MSPDSRTDTTQWNNKHTNNNIHSFIRYSKSFHNVYINKHEKFFELSIIIRSLILICIDKSVHITHRYSQIRTHKEHVKRIIYTPQIFENLTYNYVNVTEKLQFSNNIKPNDNVNYFTKAKPFFSRMRLLHFHSNEYVTVNCVMKTTHCQHRSSSDLINN